MSSNPPPEIQAAAAVVQRYLDGAPPIRVSNEVFAKMNAKDRIDYARRFPQPLDDGLRKQGS
jgi:hypothetical protein